MPEVRAELDNELTDRSIAFMKQQQAAFFRNVVAYVSFASTSRLSSSLTSLAAELNVSNRSR